MDVAEPGQPVFPSPVGPRPGVVMRQVVPRVAVGTVVLPYRAPLPLADIRALPVPFPRLQQPALQPPELRYSLALRAHRRPPCRLGGHPPADANLVRWPIGMPARTRPVLSSCLRRDGAASSPYSW